MSDCRSLRFSIRKGKAELSVLPFRSMAEAESQSGDCFIYFAPSFAGASVTLHLLSTAPRLNNIPSLFHTLCDATDHLLFDSFNLKSTSATLSDSTLVFFSSGLNSCFG